MDEQTLVAYQVPAGLSIVESPEGILKRASLVGKSIDNLVKRQPDLVQVIGGRKHPKFELLQIVGQMFHLTARAKSTTRLQFDNLDGWECEAEAFHIPTQSVVATAQGMCTSDEATWNVRAKYEWKDGQKRKIGDEPVPTFQRRSMAQTRACSKALRLAIGWVLGLAGYAPTAAEEMTGNEGDPQQGQSVGQLQRKSEAKTEQKTEGEPVKGAISDPQKKRLWAISFQRGVKDKIPEIVKKHGFARVEDITTDKYDAIIAEIEGGTQA